MFTNKFDQKRKENEIYLNIKKKKKIVKKLTILVKYKRPKKLEKFKKNHLKKQTLNFRGIKKKQKPK